MNKALRILFQLALYVPLMVLIGYFSAHPKFTVVPEGAALLRMSIVHGTGLLFRCVLPRDAVGHGHVPHLSSLEPGDVVWLDAVPSLPGRRFWWGSITGHPWRDAPEGWTPETVRTLSGGGGTRYTLTRYRRED